MFELGQTKLAHKHLLKSFRLKYTSNTEDSEKKKCAYLKCVYIYIRVYYYIYSYSILDHNWHTGKS